MSKNRVIEYVFSQGDLIHVLQYKVSQNNKIGFGLIIQTYHYGREQVEKISLAFDKLSCLDCPLSYRAGGGCYTHKGNQRNGLHSMLKSKNKMNIKPFSMAEFDKFLSKIKSKPHLTRFGAYGEPVLLPIELVEKLKLKSKGAVTAYTHQWRKGDYQWAMASVHTIAEAKEAISRGYRVFLAMKKAEFLKLSPKDRLWIKFNLIGCPAAKESKYNKTCIECKLCNGAEGKKSGIIIFTH